MLVVLYTGNHERSSIEQELSRIGDNLREPKLVFLSMHTDFNSRNEIDSLFEELLVACDFETDLSLSLENLGYGNEESWSYVESCVCALFAFDVLLSSVTNLFIFILFNSNHRTHAIKAKEHEPGTRNWLFEQIDAFVDIQPEPEQSDVLAIFGCAGIGMGGTRTCTVA